MEDPGNTVIGSWFRRGVGEVGKAAGAVLVVGLALVLVAVLWPDGFDGPVDPDRLEASGDALAAARPDLASVSTPPGSVDQGTDLEVSCFMGDSVPIGPSLSRVWTAGPETDLVAASDDAQRDMAGNGWTEAASPSDTLTRATKTVAGQYLVADIEIHDYPGQVRDLTISIGVDGPDGCTS